VRLPSGKLFVIAVPVRRIQRRRVGPSTRSCVIHCGGTERERDDIRGRPGNNRVRALLPNGRIKTVAGNGPRADHDTKLVRRDHVAMSPNDVTIVPWPLVFGHGNEVLGLSASGTIVSVLDLTSTPGVKLQYPDCDPNQLVLIHGNLFLVAAVAI